MSFVPKLKPEGGMNGLSVEWRSGSARGEARQGQELKTIDFVPVPEHGAVPPETISEAIKQGQMAYGLALERFGASEDGEGARFHVTGEATGNGTQFTAQSSTADSRVVVRQGPETTDITYAEHASSSQQSLPTDLFNGMRTTALKGAKPMSEYLKAAQDPNVLAQFNALQQIGDKRSTAVGLPTHSVEWGLSSGPYTVPQFTLTDGDFKLKSIIVPDGMMGGFLQISRGSGDDERFGYVDVGSQLSEKDITAGYKMIRSAWKDNPGRSPLVSTETGDVKFPY
jgi:hypothetical protein